MRPIWQASRGNYTVSVADVYIITDGARPVNYLSPQQSLAEFKLERNAALTTLDMDFARRMLPEARSDEVRLIAMHKARYEAADIAPELRRDSRRWLEERRYARFHGLPWPAGEEFPE